jgi:dUTP diphosphatase
MPLASAAPDAVHVLIKRLDPGIPLPTLAHPGDAGADLVAAADVELGPGERAVVPTGVAIALPDGYAAFVHPRSGLAARHGVTIVNAPGTVDAGYRGEIRVTLLNTDAAKPVRFQRGDRIAQLVIQRVEHAVFHEVGSLPGSARGDGGFGSTGGHAATAGLGDGKTADGKADGKTADGKADSKMADGKADSKTTDGKMADGKTADGKTADNKTADNKTADNKTADGKMADGNTAGLADGNENKATR